MTARDGKVLGLVLCIGIAGVVTILNGCEKPRSIPQIDAIQDRLCALPASFGNANESNGYCRILTDAVDMISAESNATIRTDMLERYVKTMKSLTIPPHLMTNAPAASIGIYGSMLRVAAVELYRNRNGKASTIDCIYPFEILLAGWKASHEFLADTSKIAIRHITSTPNRLPWLVQPPKDLSRLDRKQREWLDLQYEENRNERLKTAERRIREAATENLRMFERFLERDMLSPQAAKGFASDGYEKACARFREATRR